jgi:hypothetical protein
MSEPDFKGRSIQGLWEAYCRQVIPHASEAELAQARHAFYAACYGLLLMASEELSTMSDEAALAVFAGLMDEATQAMRQPR